MKILLGFIFCLASASFATASSLEKLEEIVSQAKTLSDFLGSTVLKERYANELKKYQFRDRYRCESFEKIIHKVQLLQSKSPQIAARLWKKETPVTIQFSVITQSPFSKTPAKIRVKYTFKKPSRKLHAIWNDPSITGCYSDLCDEDDARMPSRFSILLEGAELFYVEKDGLYADQSALFLPMVEKGKRVQLLVVGGGPNLLRSTELFSPVTQKSYSRSLAAALVGELQRTLWKGKNVIVAYDKTSRTLAAESEKKSSVRFEGLTIEDKTGSEIDNILPRKCLTKASQSKLGVLALLSGKTNFTDTIENFPWSKSLSPLWTSATKAATTLKNSNFLENLPEPTTLTQTEKEVVEKTLTKVFQDTSDPTIKANAALALAQLEKPSSLTMGTPKARKVYEPIDLPNTSAQSRAFDLFQQAINDPSRAVQNAGAIGLVNTERPLSALASQRIKENTPSFLKSANDSLKAVIDESIAASERAGIFSPELDNSISSSFIQGGGRHQPDAIASLQRSFNQGISPTPQLMTSAFDQAQRALERNPARLPEVVEVFQQGMQARPDQAIWSRFLESAQASQNGQDLARAVIESTPECKKPANESAGKTASVPKHRLFATMDRHSDDSANAYRAPQSDNTVTQYECTENGTIAREQLTPNRAIQLKVTYSKVAPHWLPTRQSSGTCRWFLPDSNGSLSLGEVKRGSFLTGKFLGTDQPDRVYLYVGDFGQTQRPGIPKGWIALCPGISPNIATIGFSNTVDNDSSKIHRYTISDLERALAQPETPIEEIKQQRIAEESRHIPQPQRTQQPSSSSSPSPSPNAPTQKSPADEPARDAEFEQSRNCLATTCNLTLEEADSLINHSFDSIELLRDKLLEK